MKTQRTRFFAENTRALLLAATLAFGWLLAFSQAGLMQTRMAIGQLYAAADICVASAHFGTPDEQAPAGNLHAGHHCAACLPALDAPPLAATPLYAGWAERLSHTLPDRNIPSRSAHCLPRPFGQAPPVSIV